MRSRAEKSSILYFAPSSTDTTPLQTQVGDTLSLDIMLNPGTNAVSLVKLELLYDQTKFEATGTTPFDPNLTSFAQVTEGPSYSPGKITATLSVGTDLTKVIQQVTRVGTLKLKALVSTNANETPTNVTHGPNSQILAIGANATADENVLSNSQPAIIFIGIPPIPTCAPKPACLNTEPKCLIPEPIGGWCPIPTPTAIPPVPTIAKCPNAQTDSMLVIDRSGSMNDRIGTSRTTKIASAKDAANKFVDILSADTRNKIGLVSFSTQSNLNSPLTNNYPQIKNLVTSLFGNGYTCHECAIKKVNQEFIAGGSQSIKKVAILLTDGKANWIEGGTRLTTQATAEQKALDAIQSTSIPNHIVFYTIGLGNDVNTAFLKKIADMTGGKYYFSPTAEDLQGIYQEITLVLAKGSVSGVVFNDANKNGILDQDEAKLEDWIVYSQPSNYTGPQPQPTPVPYTTDESGVFNIGSLCDGSYFLKEASRFGWTQTVPVNPDEYQFNITGGTAVTDKNFGNYEFVTPTPTPTPPTPTTCIQPTPPSCPGGTLLPVTPTSPLCSQYICIHPTVTASPVTPTPVWATIILNGMLDGIGSRGDNSNPNGNMSNKNPLHPTRNAKVDIYNASNQLVVSSDGTIQYSSQSGSFVGSIFINQPLTSGNYTIKTSTDNHLTRQLPGIQNLKGGQENQLQDSIFTAGDIVYDNKIDIRDYNSLIDCYSDLEPATACTDNNKKIASDLNDDGAVNQFDYNLFLREIATQPGQ